MRLVLASTSPRRAELLRAAGFEFDVMPAQVDEAMEVEETPDGYARRVAQLKAEGVAPRAPGRVILGADTIVVVDNDVLGKPTSVDDARGMLRRLSGREHEVVTAVCLLDLRRERGSKRILAGITRTTVEWAPLTPEEVEWYLGSGEPMGKAGGYAVQGLASRFVTRIDGSYSNVVGLPVAVVYDLCKRAGILVF
ncbi:MAG: septum formation protein Maf [Acidobacteria bacterium RIFCSPLOWO2_02_FULL_68_18]|nr:MAG: septum formation protein Maf [Acidobacteria bacterium RIFCSPLOWO2_02_FULL_68_18]OFW49907.1 MAG: septum formation protein Maf [Acidobacteria bacterium RIFCSPLOWO2_12_FULL_68_19]